MEGGERQLLDLFSESCGAARVRLRLFSLPSIARGAEARARMAATYHGFDTLLAGRLDGLFVTGAEPRAASLSDEAFWPELTRVIDWARTGTRSTIWSCLAAHAAVLHLDGIARRPLPAKCTGVFAVTASGDHPLLAGAGDRLQVCHSRWNGLDETELANGRLRRADARRDRRRFVRAGLRQPLRLPAGSPRIRCRRTRSRGPSRSGAMAGRRDVPAECADELRFGRGRGRAARPRRRRPCRSRAAGDRRADAVASRLRRRADAQLAGPARHERGQGASTCRQLQPAAHPSTSPISRASASSAGTAAGMAPVRP